jgi:hypothetical protein
VLSAIELADLMGLLRTPGPHLGVEPGNRIGRTVETVVQALVGWLAIARPRRLRTKLDWNVPSFDPVLRSLHADH